MLRSLAERLMRNRRVKRRLPNGAPIYLSPDSQLKYLKSDFDKDLSQMAEKFVTNSSVVWDVGANCGVMAFNAAKARQILAIEADPFLAHLIQESVALNGVPVTVVAAAAFFRPSLAEFSIARRGRASNYLTAIGGHTQSAGERSRIVVPTITLDSLLERFDPPTFIKMDVEGAGRGAAWSEPHSIGSAPNLLLRGRDVDDRPLQSNSRLGGLQGDAGRRDELARRAAMTPGRFRARAARVPFAAGIG
jgi:FkbM family methyltransferase